MTTPVSSKTQFSDIYSEFRSSKKDDRHIRAGTKDGGKALYVHDKISLGFTAGRRQAREAKRAAGATEIRNALVNQYGAKVADAVLTNVATETGRDFAAGITVGDLKKIHDEVIRQAKPDPKGQASHEALMTTAHKVAGILHSWEFDIHQHEDIPNLQPKQDNSPLGQAQRDCAELPPKARDFVGQRLSDLARDEAKASGRSVDEARLARLMTKLVSQAKSTHFPKLAEMWGKVDKTASQLMGSVRGGGRRDIGPLVKRSASYAASIVPIGGQENKAANRNDQVMDGIGGDDLLNFGEQGVDRQLSGTSIADSNAIYQKTMGAKGASRAVLFAASLSQLSIPQDRENRHYITANSGIVTGTQAAVRSFATKGHVAHVNEEFAAIANALDDAIDEYTKEQGKAGREARLFAQKVRDTIAQKGPLAPECSTILDKAMRKAGIGDKALVTKAYDEVMRQTGLDEVKPLPIVEEADNDGRERIDSTISVASLVQESDMKN